MSVALIALSAAAFAVPATLDVVAIDQIMDDELDWLASGGTVLIATNEDAGVLSGACENLNRTSGVAGAVALSRWPSPVALTIAPDSPVTIVGATAGVTALLAIDGPVTGLIFPDGLAHQASLRPGSFVQLGQMPPANTSGSDTPPSRALGDPPPSMPLEVSAVEDLALLGDVLGSGVLMPVAAQGRADACFIRALPEHRDALRSLLPSVVGPPDAQTPTIVSDRLIEGEFSRNFVAEYQGRDLRGAPYATGVSVGFLWLLIRWLKRSGDGLYSTLGAGRTARASIRAVEWLFTLGAAMAIGPGISLAILALLDVPLVLATPQLSRALLAFVLSSSTVASFWALAPMRSPLATLKDR